MCGYWPQSSRRPHHCRACTRVAPGWGHVYYIGRSLGDTAMRGRPNARFHTEGSFGRSRSAGPAQRCSGLRGYCANRAQLGGTTMRCQPNAVYCTQGAAWVRPRRGADLKLSRLVWCECAGGGRRAVTGRRASRGRRGSSRSRRRGSQTTARLGYQAAVVGRRTLSTAASGAGANQDP